MKDVAVLVVAKHALITALLGGLVEIAGHRAIFPAEDESPVSFLERITTPLILLDCSFAVATREAVRRQAAKVGAKLVVFTPSRSQAEADEIAAGCGAGSFIFPIAPLAFRDLIAASLDRPPVASA